MKKIDQSKKRLRLDKEQIRRLEANKLVDVVGGLGVLDTDCTSEEPNCNTTR